LKSGSLNLLEPPGPIQACNGLLYLYTLNRRLDGSQQLSGIFEEEMNFFPLPGVEHGIVKPAA